MKSTALLLAAATLTLAGCSGYRPSQANCFSFVARGPSNPDCTFTPLGGAEPAFVPVSEEALAGALSD